MNIRAISCLSLLFLFFVTLNLSAQATEDKKLTKALTKTEKLMENKNYLQLWKFTKKSLKTYPKEPLFHYGYACGLYFSRDHRKVKKSITSDNMFWKEVKSHLDKSKPLEIYNKKFSTSLQKEYWKLSMAELENGKFTKALHYYKWWFDFFDNSAKPYKNKYADRVQDTVYNYATREFLGKNTGTANKAFNWLFKTFYNSNFTYKYDGSIGFDNENYQFDEYKNPKFVLANTAADAEYMTEDEKQLVYLVNLVRIDPKLFKQTFVMKYKDLNGYSSNSSYFASLLDDLEDNQWRNIIYPNENLFNAAQFHADDMGANGMVGHTSSDGTGCFKRIKSFGTSGHSENCSYGLKKPMQILMQLLIDQGVESLGHRKNILRPGSSKLGTAIRKHSVYGWNCVMDFGS